MNLINKQKQDLTGLVSDPDVNFSKNRKIPPAALENLFQEFISQTARNDNYRGYKLLAIDGSDIQIATNPKDNKSFFQTKEGVKLYNLLHLNALYNLLSHMKML